MRVETTFTVSRPPREVFDYLANIENEARWNEWAIRVEQVSEGPVGPNARFRGTYKNFGVVEQVLSEYDPPRRLVYQSDAMGGRLTFALRSEDGRTSVTIVGEASPPMPMRLFEPLMVALMMRPHFAQLGKGIQRELGRS